jgi:Zn-dependent alcohol dehydrogenase
VPAPLPVRPPLPLRVVAGVMAGIGTIAFTAQVAVSVSRSDWLAALVVAVFAAAWLTGATRNARVAVLVDPAGRLVVRNIGRTRTFERSKVADVRRPGRGVASLAHGNALQLVLLDGSVVRLDATSRWPVGGHRDAAAARRNALLAWLRG